MSKKYTTAMVAIAIVIIAIIGHFQLYRLYISSADHQFLLDKRWITESLSATGGMALIMTSMMSQFFIYPTLALILISTIYAGIGFSLIKIYKAQNIKEYAQSLITLPICFLILTMENGSYGLRGHIALLMVLAATHIYLKRTQEMSALWQTCIAAATTALMYQAAGSAVLVFIGIILVAELTRKRLPAATIASVATMVVIAYVAVRRATFVDMREAMTPLQYYNWPSTTYFQIYTWISAVAGLIIGKTLNKTKTTTKSRTIIATLVILATCIIGTRMFHLVHNTKNGKIYYESYLADNENWNAIIELHKGDKEPVFFISFLNLALAKKGILNESLMRYNQMDISQEIGWNPSSTEGLLVKSCVYYHLGYVAAARQAAFELNILTPGSVNPRELMKMASTNRAMGQDDAANKYLYTARKALLYANAEEPQYSIVAPRDSRLMKIDGLECDLRDIVETNPNNKVAQQFLTAYRTIWNRYRNGDR